MCIIDILQTWTLAKRLERLVKMVSLSSLCRVCAVLLCIEPRM